MLLPKPILSARAKSRLSRLPSKSLAMVLFPLKVAMELVRLSMVVDIKDKLLLMVKATWLHMDTQPTVLSKAT